MILLRVSRFVLLALVTLQLVAGGALVHVHGDTGLTHAAFSGGHSHAPQAPASNDHSLAHSHAQFTAENQSATQTQGVNKHHHHCRGHHHHGRSHQHPEPERAPDDESGNVQLASPDAHSHVDCRSAVNDFPGCTKAPSLIDTVDIAPAAILPPAIVVAGFVDTDSVRSAPPTGPPDTPPLPFYLIHQNLRL
ncbi:MAG: hypothetical protein HUU29_05835 [Planctomycetaceae bacterium]|nr:hypothetical protein [Planctomycetaceae bacterium]